MMFGPNQSIIKSEYTDQNSLVPTQILSTDDAIKSETVDQVCLVPPHMYSTWFNCEFCDQKFHLKDRLINHVTNSHQSSINHVKSQGRSNFRNSLQIDNQSVTIDHQSQSETKHYDNNYSHSSARPFKCSLCENAFKSNRDLKS
eukprot:656818_1